MENNYQGQGDLTDILRASGGAFGSYAGENPFSDWQFPSDPTNISPILEGPQENFGDPFSNMRDPLLNELDIATSSFFGAPNSTEMVPRPLLEDEMKSAPPPCDNSMFSRVVVAPNNPSLLVSPSDSPLTAAAASPRGIKTAAMVGSDMINGNSSKGCLVENAGWQISSPRNPGIKRRKSQAKKVVCIPAPAAANGRPGGEVVPSDLWAWRKYGQKPIKGSPYPRGYYRCSSSKGCSARKQVERSRTDPNMLVITYTSEHNHPWPTQRNALAGSTRSQPSKNNANSKSSPNSQPQKIKKTKEEQKDGNNDNVVPRIAGSSTTGAVQEETTEETEKQLDMDDVEFSEGFSHQSYRPAMPESNHSVDFFADLGEIEGDPLNLLFTHGFTGDEQKESKVMDPFSLFDWSREKNNSTSFGEAKKGL